MKRMTLRDMKTKYLTEYCKTVDSLTRQYLSEVAAHFQQGAAPMNFEHAELIRDEAENFLRNLEEIRFYLGSFSEGFRGGLNYEFDIQVDLGNIQ